MPGLAAVGHVHVWSITSGHPVATLEIALRPGAVPAAVTRAVKAILSEDYGISHSTIEIVWDEEAITCTLAADSTG